MYYPDYNEQERNMQSCSNMPNPMWNMPNQTMQNMPMMMPNQMWDMNEYEEDLESMYPESYRRIYPMVCNACDKVQGRITRDMIMRMTDDICNKMEMDGRMESQESVAEDRQRNRFLNDLVSVLLIREFLHRRPGRPPFFPGRPPLFPGRPPFFPGRPPFREY
ncbi:MAG: hypothetical protein PHP54_04010 [Clostridia bacterium]|nr:hypothetical protein [Clostridia bacterium]